MMVLHYMPLKLVHEIAVHVNDRAAAGALEMKMPVAAAGAVDELVHSAFPAV